MTENAAPENTSEPCIADASEPTQEAPSDAQLDAELPKVLDASFYELPGGGWRIPEDAIEAALSCDREPTPAVGVMLKTMKGQIVRCTFEGQALMQLHKCCMDALGMAYQEFRITGVEEQKAVQP